LNGLCRCVRRIAEAAGIDLRQAGSFRASFFHAELLKKYKLYMTIYYGIFYINQIKNITFKKSNENQK
jgi:hypothetical protein